MPANAEFMPVGGSETVASKKRSPAVSIAPATKYPSLAELKASLPPAVFESSAPRSLAYVVFDTAVIAALFYAQYALHNSAYFWYAYPVYAFMQVRAPLSASCWCIFKFSLFKFC
jgi:hypothetical protein